MKIKYRQPKIGSRAIASVKSLFTAVLTVIVVLFYAFNIFDIIELLAKIIHLGVISRIVTNILNVVNYESVVTALGLNEGLMPFLSWHNFKIYTLSLLLSLIVVTIATYFVPRKGLKSEPVCCSDQHSLQFCNINMSKFQSLYRNNAEHEISHLVNGFPKNIAEGILLASSKAIEKDDGIDNIKTVLRYRYKTVMHIYENLEQTTGRVLNGVSMVSKFLLIGIAIVTFFGVLDIRTISNHYYKSLIFLTSYFLIKITDGFAKNGQYGLCRDAIPKHFLRKFLKANSNHTRFKTILLLAPYVGVYKAKEQAVLDIYSTKLINVVLEDVHIEDIREIIESDMHI